MQKINIFDSIKIVLSKPRYFLQFLALQGLSYLYCYVVFASAYIPIVFMIWLLLYYPTYIKQRENKKLKERIFDIITQEYLNAMISKMLYNPNFKQNLEELVPVLPEPIRTDIINMIHIIREDGEIKRAVDMFTNKYPYELVKSFHLLMITITDDGGTNLALPLKQLQTDVLNLRIDVGQDQKNRTTIYKAAIQLSFLSLVGGLAFPYILGDSYQAVVYDMWIGFIVLMVFVVLNALTFKAQMNFFYSDISED